MTLKDLLHSISFEELETYIPNMHTEMNTPTILDLLPRPYEIPQRLLTQIDQNTAS